MSQKPDYPPLLRPGHHCLDLATINKLCVGDFPPNLSRPAIYQRLERLQVDLSAQEICCDILVDGSFLTEHQEPGDVDVGVFVDIDLYDALQGEAMILMNQLFSYDYGDEMIDIWPVICYPIGHCDFVSQLALRQEIVEMFDIENSEEWLKGVAVIRVGETDVGLRLRAWEGAQGVCDSLQAGGRRREVAK